MNKKLASRRCLSETNRFDEKFMTRKWERVFVSKFFRDLFASLSLFSVHFLAAVCLQSFLSLFVSLIRNIQLVVRKRSLSRRCFLASQVCLQLNILKSLSLRYFHNYQFDCFPTEVPQVPNVSFVLVVRNRMQISLNLTLDWRCLVLVHFNLIFVVSFVELWRLHHVIDVKKHNQLNVAQH